MTSGAMRSKAWREQRIASGVCLRCPLPAEHGHTECWHCRVTLAPLRARLMKRLRDSRAFWRSRGWPLEANVNEHLDHSA